MVERVSTNLMYSLLSRNVINNQAQIFDLSEKMNTGKKFNSPSEDPVGIIGAVTTSGRILNNDQGIRNRTTAIADLEGQEVALTSLVALVDRVNEIAIRAGSDTLSADERILFRDEMRSLGETIVQVVNSKNGNKYLFSGEQSNVPTLRLNDGANFNTAVYKDNQDNGKERAVDGSPTSISLKDVLLTGADGAVLQNNVINPVATQTGDLDFQVNDGNGNVFNFTANIVSTDNLAGIITKINAAYTGAGGAGTVAQEAPAGYLRMDTDLIPGSAQSQEARISVLSSSDINVANEIGINRQDNFGRDTGLLNTLAALEAALTANDSAAIKDTIDNLAFNSKEINQRASRVGLLVGQAERFNASAVDLDLKLQSDLSIQQDLDLIDANAQFANLQVALQTSVRNSANFFSQSLADFIG